MGKASRKKNQVAGSSGPAGSKNKQVRNSSDTTSFRVIVLAVMAAAVTFIIYLPGLHNDFVNWDDDFYVYENSFIQHFNSTFFKTAFFGFYLSNWHPLTWISYAMDYAAWGLNPFGYHLTNNLLHSINTLIVVLLVAKLLKDVKVKSYVCHSGLSGIFLQKDSRQAGVTDCGIQAARRQSDGNDSTAQQFDSSRPTLHASGFTMVAAAVTGFLFGLHPMHVESVAWISERKDLLCALFFMLSIFSYISYRSDRSYKTYALSIFFFVLALLSKPMAVSLPLVLLVLDWYPFDRLKSAKTVRAALIEKIPFILFSFISAVLTVMAQKSAIEMRESIPLSVRLLVAAKSLAAYLLKMILPLKLTPYYPYPKDVSLMLPQYLLPSLFLLAVTVGCVAKANKLRVWTAAWFYYVITLLPVLGILQVGGQAMADRYAYLPSLGPLLLIGLMAAVIYTKAAEGGKRGPTVIIAVSVAVIASFSYATVRQIGIWKNSFTLWNYVIEKNPDRVPFAYNNLGMAYQSKGLLDMAIEQYRKGLAVKPDDAVAHYNLANSYRLTGQIDLSVGQYKEALSLNPDFVNAHTNLGNVYHTKGQHDLAIEQYRLALTLKPDDAAAYYNLANAYLSEGKLDMAIEQYQAALRLKPDLAGAYINLGNAYLSEGKFDPAIEQYRKALALKPDDALAHHNLGISYTKKGMKKEAIEEFKTALAIKPDLEASRQALESLRR